MANIELLGESIDPPPLMLWDPYLPNGSLEHTLAVFAVFAGNYQRQTTPSPQESSTAGGVRTKRQREIGRVVRSLKKLQRSHGGWWRGVLQLRCS
jgi:hypothetical protein